MGKGFTTALVSFLIAVLLISVFMIFYEGRKSTDSLPPLEEFFQMGEEDANGKLKGYQENQLLEAWGKPSHSNEEEMVWELPEGVLLVTSDGQGKISGCAIKRTAELPPLEAFSDMSMGRLAKWMIGRFQNQVIAIWGEPDREEENWSYWHLPGGTYSEVRLECNAWGKIIAAEFCTANQ